jgi:hypothetical protein
MEENKNRFECLIEGDKKEESVKKEASDTIRTSNEERYKEKKNIFSSERFEYSNDNNNSNSFTKGFSNKNSNSVFGGNKFKKGGRYTYTGKEDIKSFSKRIANKKEKKKYEYKEDDFPSL